MAEMLQRCEETSISRWEYGGEKAERDWSGRPDLNRGPLAPHASTLPDCATSRDAFYSTTSHVR